MNPMQSPNTGVGRRLCPEGREVEPRPEVLEADEIIMPGEKSRKEKSDEAKEALRGVLGIMRIWMP